MTVKCLNIQEKATVLFQYLHRVPGEKVINVLAGYHGVSVRTIKRVLEEKGISLPTRKTKKDTAIDALVAKVFDEGNSLRLLKKYKVSATQLKIILDHHFKCNPKVQPIPTKEQLKLL